MNMIETMHLQREYSDFAAVSDINLHIRKGTVYSWAKTRRKIHHDEDVRNL